MTPRQAMDFIRYHGVVLQSAKGLEPSLAVQIAGGPIRGSWWSHPQGHEIYALIQKIHKSKAVLICTLANGKITYIHRRLWPAFVCMAKAFPAHALDKAVQVHLPSGQHQRQDVPFPVSLDPCFRGNIFDHFGKNLVLGNDPWLHALRQI
ncbi:MAG: hypothetical protein IIA09_00870 [Proteobacteria bacterium]|nr:hypothetical protein [Pseudomonadota bacterium]